MPFYWLQNEYVLISITLVFAGLLVADIRLLALKFKGFAWQQNELKYIFILSSILLFLFLGIIALPLIILVYIVISVGANFFVKK